MGNGVAGEDVRALAAFQRVSVAAGIHGTVAFGASHSARVLADANLLNAVRTDVRGDTLEVAYVPGVWGVSSSTPVEVQVSIVALSALSGSGGARVEAMGLDAGTLALDGSGGATLVIAARVDALTTTLSGGSALEGDQLAARALTIDASGGSRATLRVSESVKGSLSGGSTLLVYGDPATREVDSSGGSTFTVKSN